MKDLPKVALAAGVVLGFGFGSVVEAHHSFAMFDQENTVMLDGTVKEFQWTNPHIWIEVTAATPGGPKQYSIEGRNVRYLKGIGWAFNTLKAGDKVTIAMHPLRDGAPGGSLVSARLEDGRTLNGK